MQHRRPWVQRNTLLALAVALAPLPALAAPARPPKLSPEAAQGRGLFLQLGCASCHGTVGQGGAGPRLAPGPSPLPALEAYVRNPAGDMPPFTDTLASHADLAAIHAYLTSIPAPGGGPGRP